MTEKPHHLIVTVPFETLRQATIACQTLEPDPELKPDQFTKRLYTQQNRLIGEFQAISARTLRVGVNSFMDSLGLVVECLDDLDEGRKTE